MCVYGIIQVTSAIFFGIVTLAQKARSIRGKEI